MKDKIIQLKTKDSYYILDEITYQNKRYAYAIPCDLETDFMNKDIAILMELTIEQQEIIVNEIQDDNIALEVLKIFQKRFQETEE